MNEHEDVTCRVAINSCAIWTSVVRVLCALQRCGSPNKLSHYRSAYCSSLGLAVSTQVAHVVISSILVNIVTLIDKREKSYAYIDGTIKTVLVSVSSALDKQNPSIGLKCQDILPCGKIVSSREALQLKLFANKKDKQYSP